MSYFRVCHILLELSRKTQKAPHQIFIFRPQFGIGNAHCFLTKQFSQSSALNVRFHAWETSVTVPPLPSMSIPITNLMRNQVADYHRTTDEGGMCNAQAQVWSGESCASTAHLVLITLVALSQVRDRQILMVGIILNRCRPQVIDAPGFGLCSLRPRHGFLSCASSKSLHLPKTSSIRPAPNAARQCGSLALNRMSQGSRSALLNVKLAKTRPLNSSSVDRCGS
jgi:hypothetical protein